MHFKLVRESLAHGWYLDMGSLGHEAIETSGEDESGRRRAAGKARQ